MNLEYFKQNILPIKNRLYRMALRITANPAEAEDVVQEVFIKVWEQRLEMGDVRNIEAWCMQMTKNRAIDKKRLRFNQSEGLDKAYGLSSSDHDPGRQAELNDAVGQVKVLMAELPDNQKAAMQLRDIEGMSYQEISETLAMPLNQVKTNIFRARKHIRSKLMQLWTIK
ncbi:MAG: RNA polymerase sigma factor [Lewinellaceae bacterium]|nr:RNA polymerase sigma factor [Lewinellaceae bacterium]MCB9290652.1 RNA polymerase sigma factor [Lewinellaceae bacterium]